MSSFGFVFSFVKKTTHLKCSILSRQQCFEQTEQPVKMVLRFAQQQKIQLSEMREPYFFYEQSISKDFCAKHFQKIFDNNCATYSLVFATSQTIFTDFFGSLKTSEKLSFFKNQKDDKVPGFPFPSALGGCPTTFRGYTSVAANLVKNSKRMGIFHDWVLSAERKTSNGV